MTVHGPIRAAKAPTSRRVNIMGVSRHRALGRAVAVSTIAFAAVVAVSGPAFAVYNYDISGPVPGAAGSGRSDGELDFALYNNRFTWVGEIRDICPADGYGMELRIRVHMMDGSTQVWNNVIQDVNGCGATWEVQNFPVQYSAGAAVREIRAELWATQDADPVLQIATSNWKDNPNT